MVRAPLFFFTLTWRMYSFLADFSITVSNLLGNQAGGSVQIYVATEFADSAEYSAFPSIDCSGMRSSTGTVANGQCTTLVDGTIDTIIQWGPSKTYSAKAHRFTTTGGTCDGGAAPASSQETSVTPTLCYSFETLFGSSGPAKTGSTQFVFQKDLILGQSFASNDCTGAASPYSLSVGSCAASSG